MYRRAPVIVDAPIVRSVEEHAGTGCNPESFYRRARIQRRIDVHNDRVGDIDDETIGAGDAWRVEQTIDGHAAGIDGWTLQVVGDEVRKLLRPGHTTIDRQSALRHAVLLVPVHGAKVGRPLEGRHIARPVGVEQQPEAGKAEIRRQLVAIDAAFAVVEHRRVVGELLRASVLDAVETHRFRDREPQMEESRLEPYAVARPQRVIVAKADRLPLVPAELCDRRGQRGLGSFVRCGGHRPCQAFELCVVEGLGGSETR